MPRSNRPPGPVASPCIDLCRIGRRGLCVGCRRSADEIAAWPRATDAWRWSLLRQLASRHEDE